MLPRRVRWQQVEKKMLKKSIGVGATRPNLTGDPCQGGESGVLGGCDDADGRGFGGAQASASVFKVGSISDSCGTGFLFPGAR